MRRCLLLATCLALAAAANAATPGCPSALSLVEKLGAESLIFSEILTVLGGQGAPPGTAKRRQMLEDAPARPFRACPRILSPVCSTDGQQYPNDCVAANKGAQVACRGPCPCGAAAASLTGQAGPVDPVMGACPKIYSPVCGKDGTTYTSKCMAGGEDAVACEGPCPCQQATRELLSTHTAAAAESSGSGGEGTYCPTIFAPVCSTDGETFSNDCFASAAGAEVACATECPCEGGIAGGQSSGTNGDDAVCIGIFDPVCGTDGNSYTNLCNAQVAGVDAACSGRCPCPDLILALETRGGVLLVPTDESLLLELDVLANSTDASGDLLDNTGLLKRILARHIILADPSRPPLNPTAQGTPAMTEAGERVRLVGRGGTPGSVISGPPAQEEIPVLGSEMGCNLATYLLAAPLQGPEKPSS